VILAPFGTSKLLARIERILDRLEELEEKNDE
jgi:hypothetical protein